MGRRGADWSEFSPLHWGIGKAMEFRKTGQMVPKTGYSALKTLIWCLKNFSIHQNSAQSWFSERFVGFCPSLIHLGYLMILLAITKRSSWTRNSGRFKKQWLFFLCFTRRISLFNVDSQGKSCSCWNLSSIPCFCLRNSGFHLRQNAPLNFKQHARALTPFYVFCFELLKRIGHCFEFC